MVLLNKTDSDPFKLSPLRVESLRKKVSDFILEAQFSIQVGERAALLGRSGSGKTTLLRVLAGLESLRGAEEGGRIFLGETEITSFLPQRREVGFVFQEQA